MYKYQDFAAEKTAHCARWHTMWRSMCLLTKHFTKPKILWVQRQFQRKFRRWQTPARSAISCLVQQFELIGSSYNKRCGGKAQVTIHEGQTCSYMWSAGSRVQENL